MRKNFTKICIIVGIILRAICGVLASPYTYQHDVMMDGGHYHYAAHIFSTMSLPTTRYGEFYQPPLNAFFSALWMKAVSIFVAPKKAIADIYDVYVSGKYDLLFMNKSLNDYVLSLYETTKYLQIIYSIITFIIICMIIKKIKKVFDAKMSYIFENFTICTIAIYPGMILMSSQYSNDNLSYMFFFIAIYVFILWYEKNLCILDRHKIDDIDIYKKNNDNENDKNDKIIINDKIINDKLANNKLDNDKLNNDKKIFKTINNKIKNKIDDKIEIKINDKIEIKINDKIEIKINDKLNYKNDVKKILLLNVILATSIGLAMMTKLGTAVISVILAPMMLLIFYKFMCKSSEYKKLILIEAFIFFVIVVPLSLWYPIRNSIIYDQSLFYVRKLKSTNELFTGNINIIDRIFSFPIKRLFDENAFIYHDIHEYNIWIDLIKTSTFDERVYSSDNIFCIIIYIINIIFHLFAFICLILNIVMVISYIIKTLSHGSFFIKATSYKLPASSYQLTPNSYKLTPNPPLPPTS